MNPASRIFSFSALIFVALFAFARIAYGQAVGANARLSGEVVDGMGGVVPRAGIKVEELDSGAVRATVTLGVPPPD